MVGTDEPGTLARVRELRTEVIQPLANLLDELKNLWQNENKYGTFCHSPPLAALGRLRGKENLI